MSTWPNLQKHNKAGREWDSFVHAALGRDFVPLLQTLVPDLLDREDTDVSDGCDPNTSKLCRDKKLISFHELLKSLLNMLSGAFKI